MTTKQTVRNPAEEIARGFWLLFLCLWKLTLASALGETSVGASPNFALDTQDASGTTLALSNLFSLDTRDASGTTVALSDAFSLDTRDASGTTVAVSNVFVLNTRAPDNGLAGSNVSNIFALDTRAAQAATGLAIVGPTSVASGSQTEYRVVMNYATGGAADVSINSTLAFAGGPLPYAGIGGGTVFVNRDAPSGATLPLQATYRSAGGTVTSPVLTVTINAVLSARLTASSRSLGGASYQITLDGTATGGPAPFTYRWDTNNDGVYGDQTGQHVTFNQSSSGGTTPLGLEVTDTQGNKAYGKGIVTINKTPVTNEPVNLPPVPDPQPASYHNGSGGAFTFDPTRRSKGLIVLVHGIDDSYQASWIAPLASAIEQRLGSDCPNIVVYDWSKDANVVNIDADRERAFNAIKVSKNGTVSPFGLVGGLLLIGLELPAIISDRVIDGVIARGSTGPRNGEILNNWIRQHSTGQNPDIDPRAPIHFIGHSAGGFVIGECAGRLKSAGIFVDRVTLLDTPFPLAYQLVSDTSPGYVDRCISSFYGWMEYPDVISLLTHTLPHYSRYYVQDLAPLDLDPGPAGHGLAPLWYPSSVRRDATVGGPIDLGFNLSPFVNSAYRLDKSPAGLQKLTRKADASRNRSTAADPVSDFGTFGDVVQSGTQWTLTELADAGIRKSIAIPIDGVNLKFRYKFSGAGDGDFLSVHFNGFTVYSIGQLESNTSEWVDAEVPVGEFAGTSGELVFTLVSRGSANAAVALDGIAIERSDDLDGDGLSTAQELAYGTNPLVADTDGDGLSDGEEINIFHTNPLVADTDGDGMSDSLEILAGTDPLDAASSFRITGVRQMPGGQISISWTSTSGRYYRIVRAETLDFANATVVAFDVPGLDSTTTFTDSVTPPGSKKMFYRVELE